MSECFLKMLCFGEMMDEGCIVNWLIVFGVMFQWGDVIFEIEIDKIIVEYLVLGGGMFVEILIVVGEMVDVGMFIVWIEFGGEVDWIDGEDVFGVFFFVVVSVLLDVLWMVIDFVMLWFGEIMDEGCIVCWLKVVGESFVCGEVIIEIEIDKIVVEYFVFVDGVLIEIMWQEGDFVFVGELIVCIEIVVDVVLLQICIGNKKFLLLEVVMVVMVICMFLFGMYGCVRVILFVCCLVCWYKLDIIVIVGIGWCGCIEKVDVLWVIVGFVFVVVVVGNGVFWIDLIWGCMVFVDSGGVGWFFFFLYGFVGDCMIWVVLQFGFRCVGCCVIVFDFLGYGLIEIEVVLVMDLLCDFIGLFDVFQFNFVLLVVYLLGVVVVIVFVMEVGNWIFDVILIVLVGLGFLIDQDFICIMVLGFFFGEIVYMLCCFFVMQVDLLLIVFDVFVVDFGCKCFEQFVDVFVGFFGQCIDMVVLINMFVVKLFVRVFFGFEDWIIFWQQIMVLLLLVVVYFFVCFGYLLQVDQICDVFDILFQDGG